MESLHGTEWDVVITDTGFACSLLALSLSRCGKRVLHLDRNDYYGGNEAALSLSEAEAWAARYSSPDASTSTTFTHASVTKHDGEGEKKLSSSRAYSIALAPQFIYARSNLVPALVSSRCHSQLDFQAVGSWFVLDSSGLGSDSQPQMLRVPSGREDVFQDGSLNLKAKRSLMKFLRFVASYEEQAGTWQNSQDEPFPAFLEQKFGLPARLHGPILALTVSQSSPDSTTTGLALSKIARHLRSIGVFGPGFGAVLPRWGGLAEIAQVACRACAVGGGVYVLNKSIKSKVKNDGGASLTVQLSDEETLSTAWICGSSNDDFQASTTTSKSKEPAAPYVSKSISIISSPLPTLFPLTSEGGVTPAGAVVVHPSEKTSEPPVYIVVHTSDAGECPMNQSVIYASVALSQQEGGSERLEQAITALLQSLGATPSPEVLWTLQYQQRSPAFQQLHLQDEEGILRPPPMSQDLALDDSVLENVKEAWRKITGGTDDEFMRFDARVGVEEEGEFG